ncbi:unnamed protein product [Didymodactylos carnosus]|uniref:Protein translocase subunit SecA n=1 Tax=Didymodactylos carnosus TaxID=1234261 RepID=A0A8S2DDA4_9BILA|nr:unnamed protein product [Didymodactylos carnosus]CAF3659770.1 unnamed protein product [Didymodactylos carnosus]
MIKVFRDESKSFNKARVLQALHNGYHTDKAFHLHVPAEIKYIARKHGLPKDKWDQIYQNLIAMNVDNHTKLLLAQAMKYSIKTSHVDTDLGKLLILLQKSDDARIKSEIIWALGYQIRNFVEKNSGELIEENFFHKMNSIIGGSENEFNTTAISFLKEQIQRQDRNDDGYQQNPHRKTRAIINYSKKQPQLVVTKNQQTSKINYKSSQSEESANRLNVVNIFQNLNKKIKVKSNIENLPTIPDQDGNDRSWRRTTYREVVHLYNRIKAGHTLKREDKDEYLPSKFLGSSNKWLFTRCDIELLFVDRMIADIFLEISKKQILHDNVIKSLMNCIDSLERLEEKILGNKKIEIAESIAHFNLKRKLGNIKRSSVDRYKNDPDIVAKIACKIDEECITDREKIMKMITFEVKKIRLTAISTIYNCAMRNNAILNNNRLKTIQKYLEDEDNDFKNCIIKILGDLADSNNIDYKNLFYNCLKELKKRVNVNDSIKYIYQQSKDNERCQELFNKDVISIISYLSRDTALNDETKAYCCMTINNYLERSYSDGLIESQLKILIDLINGSENSSELKTEALRSIVLTVTKKQNLPEFVIETLVESMNKFTDKFDNFVLLALEIVSQRQTIPKVDKLSIKLLDDWIIVGEGANITFEKSSKDNSDCASISSTVAQIFVNSLKKNIKISDQSLEHLTKALKSNDKQTRILAAKSLYLAVETHNIRNDILVELREYVEDRIHDVSVYSTVVYIRGLAKLSLAKEFIMTSHIELLPKIYVYEDLQLDEKSFTYVVNKNILSILLNEAKSKQFEDNIFHIFDHILFLENSNQTEVIQILDTYSANKYRIPENTIFALENTINTSEISKEVLKVFENIIKNGQTISEKILYIIANNLYLSDDDELRNKSFNLLDMINDNQDISDEIFDILELERASIAFEHYALSYLNTKTKQGQKLTVNGFRLLSKIIEYQSIINEKILSILLNISNNEQVIPNDIIEKLVQRFNPNQVHNQLIMIFENLVKNNQNISNELSSKLEQALNNKLISDKVLFIFIVRGQKGEKLSKNIILEILDKFLSIDNQLMIKQYLSVICSVIQNKDFFKQDSQTCVVNDSHVQTALIYGLEKGNQDVISKSVSGFKTLISVHKIKLEKKSINTLLDLATNVSCNKDIKQEINTLLEASKLDNSQKHRFQLSNLNCNSNDLLLDELAEFSQHKLLQENFDQIDKIINNCPELVIKVLKTLLMCSNKENIPDKLLDSITVLLDSTTITEIRSLCFKLITETAQAGRKLSDRLIDLVATQHNEKEANDILQLIAKNQPIRKELQDCMDLSLQIGNAKNISPDCLDKFLKNIRQELDEGLTLSVLHIERLLSIDQIFFDSTIEIVQKVVDIFALILMQNPDYSSNESIVNRLEKAILSKNINNNVLKAYQEVIRRKQCQSINLSRVLDTFVNFLQKHEIHVKFQLDMLICIVLASEYMKIPKLEVLESNRWSDDAIIRRWSFRGIRAAYENGFQSEIFVKWCNYIRYDLEKNTHTKVMEDLDLFETMTALKYKNFTKICNKPQNEWNRELLIFDLLERFEISEIEKSNFYKAWIKVELYEQFQKSKGNTILKLLHRIQCNNAISFNQCYDTVKILPEICFEYVLKILSNSRNPYLDLQKERLRNLFDQRLSNQKINSKYIDELVLNMISKFGISTSERLLCSIENIDNLKDFNEALDFADKNKIKISDIPDISVQKQTISRLKRSFEKAFLSNQIIKVDCSKLSVNLDNLLGKNWTFEQLNVIFSNLKASSSHEKIVRERHFVDVLEILSQYKILPTPENQEKLLLALKKPAENWKREVNIIAVENNFLEIGQIKNAAELIKELESINSHMTRLNNKNLLISVERIKRSDLVSQVLATTVGHPIYIAQWTKDQIQLWANKVQTPTYTHNYTENFLIEALAVTKRANLLDSGFDLTDAQILSCLVALNVNSDKGRLLQVGTGEGKSTIISVLAVIHALKGKYVDIITSSPVLAQRDAKEKAKFYSIFDLQCTDNNDHSIYLTGPKTCYKKQIVYGEVAQFQFDTLRTEYAQLNTLAGRKREVAIVDEVDSMLIDDSSKIAKLATTIPGMDQLQLIYHILWHQLVSLQDKIIEFNNKTYLLYGKLSFEQETVILEYDNGQGEIVKIPDLKSYIASTPNISHIGQSIPENVEYDAFIRKYLEAYIKPYIKENVKVPEHLAEFVDTQIPKWIDNAIVAYSYQENVHYVVYEGLIKPVDFNSTGVVQSCTNWSDGLHQFLQIKHNLKMASETFTTNFLSNRGYFTKYGANLFGLTGTLGSEKAKQVLSGVYNVDLVIIPSLRQKQYLSLPDIVVTNETDWLNEIYCSAVNEASKERGTLVICETIKHSRVIAEMLRRDYRSGAIKLYTMNNMNQEKNIETVKPGEIIVATNLAGRGTDIKTNEIEKHGGLHVIITFMPPNKRVEEQAFGRTARQGKRGTGQRILNAASLTHCGQSDIQEITQQRDRIEVNILEDFQEHELKVIILKDELFVKFCSLLNEIRQKIRVTHAAHSVFESNVVLGIEEQWAMFLRKIDNRKFPIDIKQVNKEYDDFSKKINEDYEKDDVIKNPYYHIVIGNDLIIKKFSWKNNYDVAMKHFDKAITLDPENSAAAFAGKGWLQLKVKKRWAFTHRRALDYKQKAIEAFNTALKILHDEEAALTAMQTFLQERCLNITTALSKQLIQKAHILSCYINSLKNAVIVVEKSQRLIQITEIRYRNIIQEYADNIRSSFKQKRENYNSGISKMIISYDGIEKGCGELCDIHLISHDNVHHYETAIRNCKTIAVIKDQNKFTIKYKVKDRLAICEVDNQELTEGLRSLLHDGSILDSDIHPKISTLIYEKVRSYNGHIRDEFLTPLQRLRDGSVYEITFNDLTVRKDTTTKDQAIDTINQIVLESEENLSPNKIACSDIKVTTNPNIEIKEATKEVALAQLRDKSSFFHRYLSIESLSPDSYQVNLEIIVDNNLPETKFGLQKTSCLASVQIAVGSALVLSGLGGTVGMGLITEGVADLFIAARAGYTRNFSWSNYGKQKTISLIISALSIGVSTLKNIGKTAQNIAVGVGEEVLEQTGTQIITNGKAVGQGVVKIGQGLHIKQMIAKHSLPVINKVISNSSPFVLDQLKPKISASIQRKVNCTFYLPKLLKLMRKMYALDLFNKQQQFKEKVNKILVEIIYPEHNSWTFIAMELSKIVAIENIASAVNLSIKIVGTLNSMYQVNIIIENIRDQLVMKLSQIDRETLSMEQLLHSHCLVNKEDAKEIRILLQTQGIIDELGILDENEMLDNQVFSEKLSHCDFNKFNKYKEKIVDFLKSLHADMLSIEFNEFSEIMKLVSDMITENTIRVTEWQLTRS